MYSSGRLFIFCFGVLFLVSCVNGARGSKSTATSALPTRLSLEYLDAQAVSELQSLALLPVGYDAEARAASNELALIDERLFEAASQEARVAVIKGYKGHKRDALETTSAVHNWNKQVLAGRRLGVDAVVITQIHRFRKREGSRVGVSNPGQLSFSIRVFRTSDSKLVWHSHYRFKDQALSENWLMAQDRQKYGKKDGLGWQDVDTVMKRGFLESFEKFEEKRAQHFTHG